MTMIRGREAPSQAPVDTREADFRLPRSRVDVGVLRKKLSIVPKFPPSPDSFEGQSNNQRRLIAAVHKGVSPTQDFEKRMRESERPAGRLSRRWTLGNESIRLRHLAEIAANPHQSPLIRQRNIDDQHEAYIKKFGNSINATSEIAEDDKDLDVLPIPQSKVDEFLNSKNLLDNPSPEDHDIYVPPAEESAVSFG